MTLTPCAHVRATRSGDKPCTRQGTIERDGKHFCAQHDPVAVETKRVLAEQERQKQIEAETATLRAERVALLASLTPDEVLDVCTRFGWAVIDMHPDTDVGADLNMATPPLNWKPSIAWDDSKVPSALVWGQGAVTFAAEGWWTGPDASVHKSPNRNVSKYRAELAIKRVLSAG